VVHQELDRGEGLQILIHEVFRARHQREISMPLERCRREGFVEEVIENQLAWTGSKAGGLAIGRSAIRTETQHPGAVRRLRLRRPCHRLDADPGVTPHIDEARWRGTNARIVDRRFALEIILGKRAEGGRSGTNDCGPVNLDTLQLSDEVIFRNRLDVSDSGKWNAGQALTRVPA